MKTLYSFAILCMALLCTTISQLSASGLADPASTTTTRPKGDCGCTGNVLKNASFEETNAFNNWTKTGSWGTDVNYAACGSDAAVLQGAGSLYQDVQVVPGTQVVFSIWGGYHAYKSQKFKLSFLDINKNVLTTESKSVNWDVDTAPSNVPILKKYTFNGTAPAGTVYVRAEATAASGDWFKVDGACMQITAPALSCGCDGNVLKNASFEDGSTSWLKTGSWSSNTDYEVCGTKAIVLNGAGRLYQDIQVAEGTAVDFSIYGGYHVKVGQSFKLTFYSAGNTSLLTKTVAVDWDVDNVPLGQPKLKQYSLNGTAPANTAYVRVEAASPGADYFKVDAGCVRLTIPQVSCCTVNMLNNGSFESFTQVGDRKVPTNWNYSTGANFTWDGGYPVCGSRNALLSGPGSFWQDVAIAGGSTATLTIWGGYHNKNSQEFKLQFVMSDGSIQPGDVEPLTKSVDALPKTSPKGLTQYTLTATAPAGAKYVRVLGSSNGDYIKVDAACLSISVPACESCADNKLSNPGFEDGLADWTKVVGTFAVSDDYVVCGTKSGKLTGKSTIAQEKEAAPGSTVTFSIYAGINTVNGQKLKLRFLNANRTELQAKETDVTKVFTSGTFGLQKFTVSDKAPLNTKYVSVEILSNGNDFVFDLGCLSIVGGTPLPVTLVNFEVKKEGNMAELVWSTTSETNSKEFEVQHSLNGKEWAVLGVVAAEGESSITRPYSYTHTTPSSGSNLYRLKMIDQDQTFAYSRIVSENFETGASAVLYPNPSSDFMKLKAGTEKIASIQIYDLKGTKVRDFAPTEGHDINISSLVQGTYIVTFKQRNGVVTKQRIQVVR